MLLVAASLALLVVYAGVKLLIQTQKETLSNLYRCAAWFFIIAGFFMLVITGACCIAMCCKYGSHMMHKEHKMMGGDNDYMKGDHHMGYNKMMKYHHGHDEDYNMYINCCGSQMGKCCSYMDACKTDTAKINRNNNKTIENR
jgi:hypothetical protein